MYVLEVNFGGNTLHTNEDTKFTYVGDNTYQYQSGHYSHTDVDSGKTTYPQPVRHYTVTKEGSGLYKRDRISEIDFKISTGRQDITKEEQQMWREFQKPSSSPSSRLEKTIIFTLWLGFLTLAVLGSL